MVPWPSRTFCSTAFRRGAETCTRGRVRSPEFLHLRARMNTTQTVQFKIWRGDANGGEFRDYTTECSEGMVVLDAVHDIQRTQANDLACRWNCKAGKCGSCSAEVNGMPKIGRASCREGVDVG